MTLLFDNVPRSWPLARSRSAAAVLSQEQSRQRLTPRLHHVARRIFLKFAPIGPDVATGIIRATRRSCFAGRVDGEPAHHASGLLLISVACVANAEQDGFAH